MPPNAENEAKVSCDISFTNPVEVSPGHFISIPADSRIVRDTLLPEMKSALSTVCKGILGENGEHFEFEDCRICWYDYPSRASTVSDSY
jgi:hypothetical protein